MYLFVVRDTFIALLIAQFNKNEATSILTLAALSFFISNMKSMDLAWNTFLSAGWQQEAQSTYILGKERDTSQHYFLV
jgi:hypothetical protein